jgi:rhamnosyltransferase
VSPPDLAILLSSFNGGRFIAEQINSIRRQSYSDWTLIVRDDGSSDDTVAIVESLASQDRRIRLLRDTKGNLGPAGSFGALLAHAREAGAPYVALADQDDVWLQTKLARELELLHDQEAAAGRATPLLVHSDLAVVREDLTLLHRSFLDFQGLRHQSESPLVKLLIQNFVTGSTVVVNRALLEAAVPLPRVIMHDWWLALCAAALGRLLFLPEATVLYRQHGTNAQGSRGRRAGATAAVRRPLAWWVDSAAMLDRAVEQARELEQRVERVNCGASPTGAMLREFCSAFGPQGSALRRLRVVYHHRIRPRTLLPYPLPFYARVLLWGGDLQGQHAALQQRTEPEAQRGAPARP